MSVKKASNQFEGRVVYDRMIEVLLLFGPIEEIKKIVHKDFMGYGTAALVSGCVHLRSGLPPPAPPACQKKVKLD